MTEIKTHQAPDIIPAASVILLQNTINGIEVFMVARNYEVDSFSGALVFPGGKLHQSDYDAKLKAFCRKSSEINDELLALRVSAIREAFEESGVLLARYRSTGEFIDEEHMTRLSPYRKQIENGETDLLALAQKEDIELATDQLVHFSNLVTPAGWTKKRFDTHFFVAALPRNYSLLHDGSETVSSLWGTPETLVKDADQGRWNIVFPTRVNLSKIALYDETEGLLNACRDKPIEAITPDYIQEGEYAILRISEDAGFPFHFQRLQRPA